MKREKCKIRPNWVERCKEIGFGFYNMPSSDGTPYWTEGVAYYFTSQEVDNLEEATNILHEICLNLVERIIKSGDYPKQYGLSDTAKQLIESSWKAKEPSLYGRFDLAFDGTFIKMLEYNADTPTSLLEAAIAQWNWLEDLDFPDQFNSLHERLIAQWKVVGQSIAMQPRVYFAAMDTGSREDWGTVEYLMDVALQAGIDVSAIPIEQIGWDAEKLCFNDLNDNIINACFKLYPWEWMMEDQFGAQIAVSGIRFVEPAWKQLLSSKALLSLLWQEHEGHPLLLPSFFDNGTREGFQGKWVRKPVLSREGANVSLVEGGTSKNLPGSDFNEAYDRAGYVLQQWMDIPSFDGFTPVIGSWVVGDESAGMGIREDNNLVTGNNSHFVPHYFD